MADRLQISGGLLRTRNNKLYVGTDTACCCVSRCYTEDGTVIEPQAGETIPTCIKLDCDAVNFRAPKWSLVIEGIDAVDGMANSLNTANGTYLLEFNGGTQDWFASPVGSPWVVIMTYDCGSDTTTVTLQNLFDTGWTATFESVGQSPLKAPITITLDSTDGHTGDFPTEITLTPLTCSDEGSFSNPFIILTIEDFGDTDPADLPAPCCDSINMMIEAAGTFDPNISRCSWAQTRTICSPDTDNVFDVVITTYFGPGPSWEVAIDLYEWTAYPTPPATLVQTWIYRSDPFLPVVGDPRFFECRGTFTLALISGGDNYCSPAPTILLQTGQPPAT